MQYGIAFAPLVPTMVLWIGIAAIVVIAAILMLTRSRGAAIRVAALALILLALANPSFTREEREPLSSVVAVVVDKSPSQNFGERTRETEQAREALVARLKDIKGLKSAWSRPVRRTAKPMAPNCSPPSRRRCPMCPPIALPVHSSSPTDACTTFPPTRLRLASVRRSMR
jgi:hypothetical protein